jgi:protein-S-isoprenylcysteine O-methyltransferase Ste14
MTRVLVDTAHELLKVLALVVIIDAILFLLAGRLDWSGAWILTCLYLVLLLVMVVWATRNAPDLLEERSRMAYNVKGWDKILLCLYTVALVGLLVVAALDAGRFRWTEMPVALQVFGVLGFILCGIWLLWVTRTNAYLSRFARIQDDRGQQVVTTGPYRYVRHPMYASIIPFVLCVALILGSWLALVPGAIIGVLFLIRTVLEDRMLQEELPGYKEYAQRVRYRLLPGVW